MKEVEANKPAAENLKREAKIMSSLNHEYIARVFHFGYSEATKKEMSAPSNSGTSPYRRVMVIEGTGYGSIERYVKEAIVVDKGVNGIKIKMVSIERKKSMLLEVWLALKYIWRKGYVHVDLKIDNVILMPDGHIRLIDFGDAVHIGKEKKYKVNIKSPNSNIAPEAFAIPAVEGGKQKRLNKSADIWSFGVLLVDFMCKNFGDVIKPEIASSSSTQTGGQNDRKFNPYPTNRKSQSDIGDVVNPEIASFDPNRKPECQTLCHIQTAGSRV